MDTLSQISSTKSSSSLEHAGLTPGGGGGGGTPLYGLYRSVQRQRVWFFSRSGHE